MARFLILLAGDLSFEVLVRAKEHLHTFLSEDVGHGAIAADRDPIISATLSTYARR